MTDAEKPKLFQGRTIQVHEWLSDWPKYEVVLGRYNILLATPNLSFANALAQLFEELCPQSMDGDSAIRAIADGLIALSGMTVLTGAVLQRAAEREQAAALCEVEENKRRMHALAATELRSAASLIAGGRI